jgi:hypothetical protein
MTIRSQLCAALLLTAFLPTGHALADDKDVEVELRPETICRPFDGAVEAIDDFGKVKDKYRDVVDVIPRPRFKVTDDGPLPERVYFASADRPDADVRVGPDGVMEGLIDVARANPESELCVKDPSRAGQPQREDSGLDFVLGALPQFTNRTGTFTLAELQEGTKDGRRFFKKMAPSLVSFMVPKLTHVSVSHPFDDEDNLPTVEAFTGDVSLGPVAMERFDVSQLIEVDVLEEMGADRIVVTGDHRLYPVPDADTMRKYMGGDNEE